MNKLALIVLMLLVADTPVYADAQIFKATINKATLEYAPPPDPCAGKNVGDTCTNGVLYAGTGFAGLGSYKYMTTPGNCSNYVNNFTAFTPTCNGATDSLWKRWAAGGGTTASNVVTGAISTTDGAANTATLATNYTDTDAARYCANMVYPATDGYTDWYLPAKNEVQLVLYAMKVAGKGNFDPMGYYWSSTEDSATKAWDILFMNGGWNQEPKTAAGELIRCVRKY